MSILDAVKNMHNETAWQQARDYKQLVEDSTKEGFDRNVGGAMGKNDFLMLLSAQLRYQDPMNPTNDSDFAAQLAQFSALEQMQNMNATLSAMSNYQAYSLVGKYVVATAMVDGELSEIPGIVDSVFLKNGIAYAQIGEFVVPVSAISEVFDAGNMLTTDSLMNASRNLIGRTVMAHEVDEKGNTTIVEGVVTRITVDKGTMFASLIDENGDVRVVPVNMIFDIRETNAPAAEAKPETPEKPKFPPGAENIKVSGDGFIETCEKGVTELGRWDWDEVKFAWIFTAFEPLLPDDPDDKDDEDGLKIGDETKIGDEPEDVEDPDVIDQQDPVEPGDPGETPDTTSENPVIPGSPAEPDDPAEPQDQQEP